VTLVTHRGALRSVLAAVGHVAQAGDIEDVDLLPAERDQASVGELLQ